jgi:hypothetical protein
LWNVALIDMTLGRFEAGWAGREIRWKTGLGMKAPKFIQPQWLGDRSIESKTVLLFADEGIGDCFQFARYKPMVAELGAKVILAVQEPAVSLLSRMPGVVECIPKSTTFLPAFDLHCGVSSLPLAFKTTRPRRLICRRLSLCEPANGSSDWVRTTDFASDWYGPAIRVMPTTETGRCRCRCWRAFWMSMRSLSACRRIRGLPTGKSSVDSTSSISRTSFPVSTRPPR